MIQVIRLFHIIDSDLKYLESKHLLLSKIKIISSERYKGKKYTKIMYDGKSMNLSIKLDTLKKYLSILTIILVSTSCVTRRACESKFGQCGDIAPIEIVKEYRDTLIIPKAFRVTDTLKLVGKEKKYITDFLYKNVTLAPVTPNIKWTYINDSTISLYAICKPDTLRIKGVNSTITKTQIKTVTNDKLYWWVVPIICVLTILLIISFIKR